MDFDRPLDQVLAQPDGYRVRVYHPHCDLPALDAAAIPQPDGPCELPLQQEYSLSFALVNDLPAPSDVRFEAIARKIDEIDDSLIDNLFDLGIGTGSKLGGYAYFTQEDPRSYELSNEQWHLLFQMDTHDEDDDVWIMWGDCGVGNFFIQPERTPPATSPASGTTGTAQQHPFMLCRHHRPWRPGWRPLPPLPSAQRGDHLAIDTQLLAGGRAPIAHRGIACHYAVVLIIQQQMTIAQPYPCRRPATPGQCGPAVARHRARCWRWRTRARRGRARVNSHRHPAAG